MKPFLAACLMLLGVLAPLRGEIQHLARELHRQDLHDGVVARWHMHDLQIGDALPDHLLLGLDRHWCAMAGANLPRYSASERRPRTA